MVENLEELNSEQKKDLQDFVNIAHKKENLDLWWTNKTTFKSMPLEDYFEYEIDDLNEIFIHFPDKETGEILQIISEIQIAYEMGVEPPPHTESQQYCFRFKTYENVVNQVKTKIINPSEFETKQLLEGLQKLLIDLKMSKFEYIKLYEKRR